MLDGRWLEAEYFRSTSQESKLDVNLIQLFKLDESAERPTAPILRAMEQIENFQADVILLYASTENIKRMLQQVYFRLHSLVSILLYYIFIIMLS